MRTISEIWKVMSTILLIIVILLLISALPSWLYSRGWGYYPSRGSRSNSRNCFDPRRSWAVVVMVCE
jgi:hypothetical protein